MWCLLDDGPFDVGLWRDVSVTHRGHRRNGPVDRSGVLRSEIRCEVRGAVFTERDLRHPHYVPSRYG